MTQPEPKPRKSSGQSQPAGQRPAGSSSSTKGGYKQSTSPTGTPRVGRRQTSRYRQPEPTLLQRLRTPALALIVIAAVGLIGLFAVTAATSPAYACAAIDTPLAPVEGELGQVQTDQGNRHVSAGDKVTYQLCPPASGQHINNPPRGPIPPKLYGPNDNTVPNGWVHNLEHGGLVLLYSCDKGACDEATQAQLRTLVQGFPASAVCGVAPGLVSPVVVRFEQMPTKFTALVWDRVLYLDTLDVQQVYDFYTRYAERVSEGRFVAPPEPQCAVPSPSTTPSTSPAESPAASPSTPAASPSTPAESPSTPAESPSPASS